MLLFFYRMAPSRRTLSILLALLISVSFVVAGYVFSSGFTSTFADAATSEELLREYAKKDTDADGLPDWQETLYGADPTNPRSLDPSKTDKEAVDAGAVQPRFKSEALPEQSSASADVDYGIAPAAPGSLTEKFSRAFLTAYLQAGGGQVVDQTKQEEIVLNLLTTFTQESESLLSSSYTLAPTQVSSTMSVEMYADVLAETFITNDVPEASGGTLSRMEALLVGGDTSVRPTLVRTHEAYAAMAADLKATNVPSSVTEDHVRLVRALEELSRTTEVVASYESDPVAALGAIGLFPQAVTELSGALQGIADVILLEGEPAPSTGAALIVRLVRSSQPAP